MRFLSSSSCPRNSYSTRGAATSFTTHLTGIFLPNFFHFQASGALSRAASARFPRTLRRRLPPPCRGSPAPTPGGGPRGHRGGPRGHRRVPGGQGGVAGRRLLAPRRLAASSPAALRLARAAGRNVAALRFREVSAAIGARSLSFAGVFLTFVCHQPVFHPSDREISIGRILSDLFPEGQ